MKTEIKKLSETKTEILFEIPWDEFKPFWDRTVSQLSGKLQMPGFRAGKVPREIAEKEIGREKILTSAAELCLGEKYQEFVKKEGFEVIGSPRLTILKLAQGNPFSFKVEVDLLPRVALPDYRTIAQRVKKENPGVEEKEIEDSLKWLQLSRAKFSSQERKASLGDFVEIEYQSPQIEGGKTWKDKFLLGQGQFVQGFEGNLQGLRPGEKKEFEVVFPKDYPQPKLAGHKIKFVVRMIGVQEVKKPELNDEFAKSLGRFNDLNALKENIKRGILQEKRQSFQQKWREKVLKEIAKNCSFTIPQNLLDIEIARLYQNFQEQVKKSLKMSFPDYLKEAKKGEEEIKNSFKETAKENVKEFLILREIGKAEKILVRDEEVEKKINDDVLRKYSDISQAKKEVDLNKLRAYYRSTVYNEKVFQLLENLSA